MDSAVIVSVVGCTAAAAAAVCAWLAAPRLEKAIDQVSLKARARLAAEITREAESVLADCERALSRLSVPEQLALSAVDAQRLLSCRRSLEALLTKAAYVAGRSNEILLSPKIARSRSKGEVLELLRINAQHASAIRAAADEELHQARCWIDRGWATTGR